MAYLGKKSGAQLLAAENRSQAELHRANADALKDSAPDIAAQWCKETDKLEAEAEQFDPITPARDKKRRGRKAQ